MNSNLIELGAGFILIIALILSNNTEAFERFTNSDYSTIPSIMSMPKNNIPAESGMPLFLNMMPRTGTDFKLFDFIKRLRVSNNFPVWNGIYKNNVSRDIIETKKLPPIILVPGIGASPIFAKWNINSSDENCVKNQDSWTQIWPPNISNMASSCWVNNTRINVDQNGNRNIISNANGVETNVPEMGSIKFSNDDYMSTLIASLEAIGYKKGVNLFAACYDFRKIGDMSEIDNWCMSLSRLIEYSCSDQENKCMILGHDLGAVIANYFLVGALQEWKDRFVGKFISVSGAFGGCPKALRAVLSGVYSSESKENFNKVVKETSGLMLMLPNSNIYGNIPLIEYDQSTYTAQDIPKLISSVSDNAYKVYQISQKIRDISMNAPGVEVHILGGNNLDTDSFYKYSFSLEDEPERNAPFYELELPFNQKYSYPDRFKGDGTMPKFALECPIWWSKFQNQPVFFQFFTGSEHTKILSTFEPVEYILNLCE